MGLFGRNKKGEIVAKARAEAAPAAGQAAVAGMEIIPQITIGLEKGTGRNVFICTLAPIDAIRVLAGAIQGLVGQLNKAGAVPSIIKPPPGMVIQDPRKP